MQEKKVLSILVTAGGTQEDIDTVRSITNHATGRLGSMIADVFSRNGADVTYLCGETSLQPALAVREVIRIRSVAQLEEKLDTLLKDNVYDCVIHSMAVSDFTPCAVTTADELAEAIARGLRGNLSEGEISGRIRNVLLNDAAKPATKKISSGSQDLVIVLKPTPKVIGRIKAIQPQTLLVGFKLLSGAREPELLEAGLSLISRAHCDYVLANDLSGISGDTHKAVLLDKNGVIRRAGTKPDVAQMIFETVTERIDKTK